MDIRAAEISAILKDQIANFGAEAEVSGVLSGIGYVERNGRFEWRRRNRREARRRA